MRVVLKRNRTVEIDGRRRGEWASIVDNIFRGNAHWEASIDGSPLFSGRDRADLVAKIERIAEKERRGGASTLVGV